MYLLNTDVLLELMKRNPCTNLLQWCAKVPAEYLYVSVLMYGSLQQKLQEICTMHQRPLLEFWVQSQLLPWFGKNVILIDAKIARRWGDICYLNLEDTAENLLVATAIENNFILVTGENVSRVEGIKVFNPFI
jgi:predicted nucleic acid-binding protein